MTNVFKNTSRIIRLEELGNGAAEQFIRLATENMARFGIRVIDIAVFCQQYRADWNAIDQRIELYTATP